MWKPEATFFMNLSHPSKLRQDIHLSSPDDLTVYCVMPFKFCFSSHHPFANFNRSVEIEVNLEIIVAFKRYSRSFHFIGAKLFRPFRSHHQSNGAKNLWTYVSGWPTAPFCKTLPISARTLVKMRDLTPELLLCLFNGLISTWNIHRMTFSNRTKPQEGNFRRESFTT